MKVYFGITQGKNTHLPACVLLPVLVASMWSKVGVREHSYISSYLCLHFVHCNSFQKFDIVPKSFASLFTELYNVVIVVSSCEL